MEYRNPTPTVDVSGIAEIRMFMFEVLLIERLNPLMVGHSGGFVDEWEMVETAAIREVKENRAKDNLG